MVGLPEIGVELPLRALYEGVPIEEGAGEAGWPPAGEADPMPRPIT